MRSRFVSIGLGVGVGLLIAWAPGLTAMLGLLWAAGWLIHRWAPAEDRDFLVRLYALAVVARVAAAAVLHLWAMYDGRGYLLYGIESFDIFGDSAAFSERAWIIAQTWKGGYDRVALDQGIFQNQFTPLIYLYIWVYYAFGFCQFAVKLFSVLFGALTAVMVYLLAKSVVGSTAGSRTARVAAWLMAFFPSTFLWSLSNLKEAPSGLALAWGCWVMIRLLQRGVRTSTLWHIAGVLGLIWLVRAQLMVPFLGCLLVGGALGWLLMHPRPVLIAALVLMLAGVVGGVPATAHTPILRFWRTKIDRVMNELVSRQKGHQLSGGSAYTVYSPSVSRDHSATATFTFTPGEIVKVLMLGWAYFLLSPFPWRVSSGSQVAVIPEIWLWYVLLAFALVGAVRLLQQRNGSCLVMAVPVIVLTTMLAMSTGNQGIAFRHRGIFVPVYLTFSAVGLMAMRERWSRDAGPLRFV